MALISPLQMQDSFERSTLWTTSTSSTSDSPASPTTSPQRDQSFVPTTDDRNHVYSYPYPSNTTDTMGFATETLPPLHYNMNSVASSSAYYAPSYHYQQRHSPYMPPPPHYYTSNIRNGEVPSPVPYSSIRTSVAAPPLSATAALPLPLPLPSPASPTHSPPHQPLSHPRTSPRLSHSPPRSGSGSASPTSSPSALNTTMPRLPPIFQVEKQQVTTQATQAASASRRRNDASFKCPVPGCGSTFTRRFNLRGHLRSHTEERPFVCEWAGCGKGFARQHDCKRHQALHSSKAGQFTCDGCGKPFSRMDALNRHLRSEGGLACKLKASDETTSECSVDGGSPRRSPSTQ